MTPIIWRDADVGDAEALAYLGAATFMATFAFDHPGQPMMEHLRQEHSAEYYAQALRNPATDLLMGETPLGAPVGYAMITPAAHPELQQACHIELKRQRTVRTRFRGGRETQGETSTAVRLRKKCLRHRLLRTGRLCGYWRNGLHGGPSAFPRLGLRPKYGLIRLRPKLPRADRAQREALLHQEPALR